mmetsp:Transcript_16716/g.50683  ORF Transcript_16716/g.50683 Transcript_16716/m.50683 type:complete len:662 (+) Transcript_16716:52-2037(+)
MVKLMLALLPATTRAFLGPLRTRALTTRRRMSSTTMAPPPNPKEVDYSTADLPTNADEALLKVRHSSAHVMGMAVQRLFPDAQVTVGPWIEHGFYYDFYRKSGEQFSTNDLKAIQKEMTKIIKKDLPIRREVVSRDEARSRIETLGETFKLEILEENIKDESEISIYHVGDEWWDLCAGPHVESTGQIDAKAVQLQTVAGAYWRGDETREMLQRIYGTAWLEPWQLKEHKRRLEEAKKRDHRVLGKKLDLFSLQEDAGGGLVFWHPKGARVRQVVEDFWKDAHRDAGYDLLYTPHVANLELWKTSGHVDFYKDGMFDPIAVNEDTTTQAEQSYYQLKPMNCPFHCLVYKDTPKSYRDLPLRWAELGTVYRYERSGTLHGLMRVRGFTQDDAHVFCTPDQLQDEIRRVLDLTETILQRFGFLKFDVMLSTRPQKAVGSDEIWDRATSALTGALRLKGWHFTVDEGGGAFYGPKIDVKITDALGRKWQCSTIQCDFNLPERFDLAYSNADADKVRPIMVHRAIFGSVERFFAILLESCAGDLPLWLAPTQLRFLPVTDAARDYCHGLKAQAAKAGVRCEVDPGKERLAKQIRNAETQRVPVMAVVGDKEMAARALAVRARGRGDLGTAADLPAFFALLATADTVHDLPAFVVEEDHQDDASSE